jgi:AAA15 family ATPase/GTPase
MQKILLDSKETREDIKDFYTPFLLITEAHEEPTSFEICVSLDGVFYRYGFSYNYRGICKEFLFIKPPGKDEVPIFEIKKSPMFLTKSFSPEDCGFKIYPENFIEEDDFLIKGWKYEIDTFDFYCKQSIYPFLKMAVTEFNSHTLKKLYYFFKEHIVIVEDVDDLKILPIVNKTFSSKILESVGIDIKIVPKNKFLEYRKTVYFNTSVNCEDEDIVFLDNKNLYSLNQNYMSPGTKALISLSNVLYDVFKNKKFLIVDGIEKHLHPHIVEFIIYMFVNTGINRKGAQLLAVTHNTNLLSSRMLGKDQVWFTEKDKKQSTSLYPLLSFEGESVDLEREYFAGHYGALPYVDYWKSFEE